MSLNPTTLLHWSSPKPLAGVGTDYHVHLTVITVDEKTETLRIEVIGEDIDFKAVQTAISSMSGSLHSIDEVEVQSTADDN